MLHKLKTSGLFLAAAIIMPTSAFAISINEYEQKSPEDQIVYIKDMVRRAANSVKTSQPQLAQDILNYFLVLPPSGQGISKGMDNFFAKLNAYEILAHRGQLDPDKVQVESLVRDIIKENLIKRD
jgi:hypothetical protein